MGYIKIEKLKEGKKKRTWRWTEKQLHSIPAMCCKLQPATILKPEGETRPCVENEGWVEMLCVSGRESLTGLLVPAPHLALCSQKILPCSKVIAGITGNLTVTVVTC